MNNRELKELEDAAKYFDYLGLEWIIDDGSSLYITVVLEDGDWIEVQLSSSEVSYRAELYNELGRPTTED